MDDVKPAHQPPVIGRRRATWGRFREIAAISALNLALLPRLSLAALNTLGDVVNKLCAIYKWIYTAAIIVGVVFIVVAAFQYMTAGGEAEKVTKAHKALTWAVVGIAVAILSRVVPNVISIFLGGPTVDPITGSCS